MPERSFFTKFFDSQRVNGSQALLKSARQQFYPNISLISDKLSWETSPLIRSEILELFVSWLTVYHMYSRVN